MDKDKFRELLQAFEQRSFKPEVGPDSELFADCPRTSTPGIRGSDAGIINVEPSATEVSGFLATVKDNSTSFPELEATHPPPDSDEFWPSSILKSTIAGAGNDRAEMHVQQQLHTAARFRFTAGLLARVWFQLGAAGRDKTASKSVKAKLAGMEADLVAMCSASLIEAGQLEAQAQEFRTQSQQPPVSRASTATGSQPVSPTLQEDPGYNGLLHHITTSKPVAAAAKPDPQEIPLGARMKAFAPAWVEFTTDPWVLDTVTEGLRFDFSADPEFTAQADPEYTAEQSAAIEKVIRWDLGDKVIEEIPYRPDLFVSHMFTLPIAGKLKSLVEFRLINKFLETGGIVVEEPPALCSLLKKHDWITRVNIKCAYPSVPIHPDHQRYVVFKYEDRYYQYRALPFGISVASRVFTKLLQAALQPLRAEGYRLTSHIDEICLLHSSFTELTEQTKRLCRHLVDLGFLINMPTSDLVPQQNQRFLGFVFNTIEGVVQFPKDQIKKVRRAALNARGSDITAKHLASLLGKIRSVMPAVGPELWRIQEIERCLNESITTPESWNEVVKLSACALDDIGWICDNILGQKSMAIG